MSVRKVQNKLLGRVLQSRVKRQLLLGASLAVLTASPAWADCAPDPVSTGQTVNCNGTDADGVVINKDHVTVNVVTGATVKNVAATTNPEPNQFVVTNTIFLNVSGEITDGVTVQNAPPIFGFPFPSSAATDVTINVDQFGKIGGSGIVVNGQSSFFSSEPGARVSVFNSGSIIANSAQTFAISAGLNSGSLIAIVRNDTSGVIGGIEGPFGSIVNYGSITGTDRSAIRSSGQSPNSSISNFGLIQNSSGAATIDYAGFSSAAHSITNSGSIENLGVGPAISAGFGGGSISITNNLGGLIRSSGGPAIGFSANHPDTLLTNQGTITGAGTAIQIPGRITLINQGTINGNVNLAVPSSFALTQNVFYSAGGIVNGNLVLGNGRDHLIVDLGAPGPLAGVTGSITTGPGSTMTYFVKRDSTASILVPANFAATSYELFDGAKLTLTGTAPANSTLGFAGVGSVDLTANMSGDGSRPLLDLQALSIRNTLPPFTGVPTILDFVSRGNLTVTSNGSAAPVRPAVVTSVGSFTNQGTITVRDVTMPAFGDPLIGIFGNGQITNNGIIEVAGAIGIGSGQFGFGDSGLIVNNGIIRQIIGGADGIGLNTRFQMINNGTITTGGSAVVLGSPFAPSGRLINNGLLRGANSPTVLAGNTLSATTITNNASGRIEAGTSGVAVRLSLSSALVNYGTIIGNIDARDVNLFGNIFAVQNLKFTNSGTITGNVDLSNQVNFPTGNVVRIVSGGVINGNLTLGSGADTLVVDLGATGPFAGVTGTIYANADSSLRYLVSSSVTAKVPTPPSTFSNWAFELANNSTLTLKGPVAANTSLGFAGTGTVESRLTMTSDGLRPLLNFLVPSAEGFYGVILVSNTGTLSVVHTDLAAPAVTMVIGGVGTFNNIGTMNVRENVVSSDPLQQLIGVAGTGTLINSGTINVGGGYAMASLPFYGSSQIINNGAIKQIGGAAPGTGILIQYWGATTINNGSISTDGPAVRIGVQGDFNGGLLINNGQLNSRKSPTVVAGSIFNARVLNSATGTIAGGAGGLAVRFDGGGSIENRGTISGNVEMGLLVSGGSFFYNNDGTLSGNLTFGSGDDALLLSGGKILGTNIDGGAGTDFLGIDTRGLSLSNFDLKSFKNFENLSIFGGGEFSAANVPSFGTIAVQDTRFTIGKGQTISTGSFTQLGGRLVINGTLDSYLLPFGAIISGTGTIVSPSLQAYSSFFAPADAGVIGRLTVKGDVELFAGSALMADVGGSDSDRLIVRSFTDLSGNSYTGALTLWDAALNLSRVGTGPQFGKTYTIATAEGGVFGQFSSVQGAFGVLSPVVSYGQNAVTVNFAAGSLAAQLPQGATPLELSFAKALDGLRTGNYGNLSSFYGAVDVMDPRSLSLALGSLNPATAGEAGGFYRQQGMQMVDLLAGRIGQLGTDRSSPGKIAVLGLPGVAGLMAHGSTGTQAAALPASLTRSLSGNDQVPARLPDGMSGFVSSGIDSRSGGLSAAGGTDRRSWHMAMGLEMRLGDASYLGTAFAHTEGLSGVRGSQAEAQTTQVAGYGAWRFSSRGYLGGLAAMGFNRIGTMRNSWDGQSSLAVQAHSAAFSYSVQAEAGYDLPLPGALTLTPHAALRYSGFGIDRLNETGNQAALRLSDISDKRLEAQLGVRLSGAVRLGGGWRLTSRAELEWNRTLAGGNGSALVQFAAVDAASFRIALGSDAPSSLKAKGGITLGNDKVSFTLAGSSETGWAGQQDSRAAAELLLAF